MLDKLIIDIVILMAPFSVVGEEQRAGESSAADFTREIQFDQKAYATAQGATFFRELAKE